MGQVGQAGQSPASEERPLRECSIAVTDDGGASGRGVHQSNLWPGGLVPYQFDVSVSPAQRQAALEAMGAIEAVCRVRFTPRANESAYLNLRDSTQNSSQVGRSWNGQDVHIYNWNQRFVIVHELMHALGIWHEQQRPDRDGYVRIVEGNVRSGYLHNFAVVSAVVVGPYDFDSVMHYGAAAFSSGGATIEVLPPFDAAHSPLGQRDHLSDGDVLTLQTMYGAPGPPINDACSAAVEVAAGQEVAGALLSASGGGPSSCGGSSGNPDVWYRFRAPDDGMLRVSTCGTNDSPGLDLGMHAAVSLYAGCAGAEIACSDGAGAAGPCASDLGAVRDAAISHSMAAGDEVWIRVSHAGDGFGDGGFRLRTDFGAAGCVCEAGGDPGVVDVLDLLAYLDLWFARDAAASLSGDGAGPVGVADLLIFLDCWFAAGAGSPC